MHKNIRYEKTNKDQRTLNGLVAHVNIQQVKSDPYTNSIGSHSFVHRFTRFKSKKKKKRKSTKIKIFNLIFNKQSSKHQKQN